MGQFLTTLVKKCLLELNWRRGITTLLYVHKNYTYKKIFMTISFTVKLRIHFKHKYIYNLMRCQLGFKHAPIINLSRSGFP